MTHDLIKIVARRSEDGLWIGKGQQDPSPEERSGEKCERGSGGVPQGRYPLSEPAVSGGM